MPVIERTSLFKVAANSNPASLAGAIAARVKESGRCELQAMGPAASNQAIKAIAIARGFLAAADIDVVCIPRIVSVWIDAEERTAISIDVEPR